MLARAAARKRQEREPFEQHGLIFGQSRLLSEPAGPVPNVGSGRLPGWT